MKIVTPEYKTGLLAPKRRYPRFDFGVATDTDRDRLYRHRSGSSFERIQEKCSAAGRRVGVEHHCHSTHAGRDLF
jgi:hypothetical protein